MSVTINDVARHAGVGIGTVSRVINNRPNVSAATRKRVEDAIAELAYRPNPIAQRLSLGKTLTIGAIVPMFTRPAFVERLRGVVDVFTGSEYDLVIYNVESAEQRNQYLLEGKINERVDGLIIISIQPSAADFERLIASKLPIVVIDAEQEHPNLNSVTIDDVAGGRLATQHLIDLGHTRIGYISDRLNTQDGMQTIIGNSSMRDRLIGYRQALETADIPFDPTYHKENVHSRSAAHDSAIELLRMDDRPTAIFAASDTQAFGVLRAAEQLNLRVPEQVSVIGYDDIEAAEYLHLTTIRQHLIESGMVGAQLMLQSLTDPSAPIEQRRMPVDLIKRQTTALFKE